MTEEELTANLESEIRAGIGKVRALRVNKDSPRFLQACCNLGVHEAELQLKYRRWGNHT